MGRLQTTLVLLILGCLLDVSMCAIPDPAPKPGPTVLTKGDVKDTTTLMACTVAVPDDNNYKTLTWKKEGVDTALCTSTKTTVEACSAGYGIHGNTKQNLITKTAVDLTHAGKYTCTLSDDSGNKAFPGQLTVVDVPVCPNIALPKDEASEITCSVKYSGSKPNIVITGTGVTAPKNEDGTPIGDVKQNIATATVTPTAGGTYTCTVSFTTPTYSKTCTITSTVYNRVIDKPPQTFTFAKVDVAGNIPCTVKADGDYGEVKWYEGEIKDANKLCTGKKTGDPVACTAAGYTIDKPAKHDLTITKVVAASMDKTYSCVVEKAGAATGEKKSTKLAFFKDPTCEGLWADSKLTLICKVEFKGAGAPTPTMKLFEGDTELTTSATGAPIDGEASWKITNETITMDKVTPKYTCKAYNGATLLGSCDQSGASALHAKFFQSTLLSLVVVFMLNRFK